MKKFENLGHRGTPRTELLSSKQGGEKGLPGEEGGWDCLSSTGTLVVLSSDKSVS